MVRSPATVQMFSVITAQTATEEHKPTSSQMPDVRQVKEEVYDTFKQNKRLAEGCLGQSDGATHF